MIARLCAYNMQIKILPTELAGKVMRWSRPSIYCFDQFLNELTFDLDCFGRVAYGTHTHAVPYYGSSPYPAGV